MKQVVERALSEGAIRQKIMEMMTGGLHAHDEKIGQIQSNLTLIGDQVLQTVTQLFGWEAKVERLEREISEMASKIWKSLTTYEWRAGGEPSMYSHTSGPAGAHASHGEAEVVNPIHASREDRPANPAISTKGAQPTRLI